MWSKWGFLTFTGNLSHWPQLFLTENDSTKCLWTPRENRISGKNLVLEILSCLQIIFVSKFRFWMILRVLGHFLEFEQLDFSDFAYYNRQAWYLAGTGGLVAEQKFSGPNLGPNLVQNRFLLISWHWLIQFVWYCIFWLLLMIFDY